MPTPNSPNESNVNSAQLPNEVGDCPHCAALFTLPLATEPFDSVACPACEQSLAIDDIKLRKVQVAKRIEKLFANPPQSLPTVADLLATATATKANPQKVAAPELSDMQVAPDPGHESLDDWLRRTTGVPLKSEKTDALAETESNPLELTGIENATQETTEISSSNDSDQLKDVKSLNEKKTLSKTLGWNPGSFSLETPAETDEGSALQEQTETIDYAAENLSAVDDSLNFNSKKTVENIDKFVSSLRDTSADQLGILPTEENTHNEVLSADQEAADDFSFDFKKNLLETDEASDEVDTKLDGFRVELKDQSVPFVETSSKGIGWGAPLSALAGMLVVGGVSYVVLMNQFFGDEKPITTSNNVAIVEPVEPLGSNSVTDRGIEVANFETTESVDAERNEPKASVTDTYTNDRYSQSQDRYNEPNPFAAADALPFEQSEGTTQATTQASFDETPGDGNQSVETPQSKEQPLQRFVGAPSYSLNELQAALDYSAPAGKGFARGTLSDPEQAQEMGKLYGDLCYLAQVITLLDTQNMPNGLKTTELLAVDVYKRMLLDEKTSDEINQVASHWINWTGRPYGGVFLQGIPDDMTRVGDLYQYRFPLGDSFAYVVTEEPIDINRYIINEAKQMGVLGIVVEDPNERIAGYEGDAERIIWCRKTIPINNSRWSQ